MAELSTKKNEKKGNFYEWPYFWHTRGIYYAKVGKNFITKFNPEVVLCCGFEEAVYCGILVRKLEFFILSHTSPII